MSLRTRIAAAAGIAVALVVVIAAVAIYLGVRAELRGEVDNSLRDRASALTMRGGGGGDRERGPGEPDGGGGGPGRTAPSLPSRRSPSAALRASRSWCCPRGAWSARPRRATRFRWTPIRARSRAAVRASSEGREGLGHPRARPDPRHRGSGRDPGGPSARRGGPAAGPRAAGAAARGRRGRGARRRPGRAWWPGPRSRPIDRFTRRTEEIAGDPDPSHRIDVTSKDELGRLARSFNTTLDSLERSVEAQRQLVADASHELRTPIASLRANIQTLEHAERLPAAELRSLRADIVAELDELTALVADIVELARGAKPGESEDEVRLDEIVESVAHRARGPGERDRDRRVHRAHGRARRTRPDPAGGVEPGGQRAQVEPRRRPRGDRPRRRTAHRARPRSRLPGVRPPVRLRPLLPGRRRALPARLGARSRDRAPGRRGARRRRGGRQRARWRRGRARVVREALRAPAEARPDAARSPH